MEIYLIKQFDNSFKVSHGSDWEKIKKIKAGEEFKCSITRPRNLKFHRKFFALINMVYENQEVYDNIDRMRYQLTMAAGYYNSYFNHKGIECFEPKSISFAKMDQDEFDELYNRFLDTVVEINGFDKQLMIENIEDFM